MPTKILVADDSATMRRVLEMTFAGEDASVVSVDSGDAALNKLGDFGPDVVFVDAALAGADGYEVARRIKSQQAKVAVIVMASQHNPYDDGKGRAAGVDDHISKPFDTQSVIDRVGQVLARPRSAPTGAGAAAPEAPRAAAAAPAVARPPAPVAAAPAATPAASAQRMAQGTRMGLGAPVPLAPAASAKPAAAPQPVPAAPLRANPTMPMAPAKPAVAPAPPVAVARPPAAPTPASSPAIASVSAQASSELAGKLGQLGLSREQIDGVLALSREVIEQVVWEVVPVLAEQLIKEELKRLTAD